MRAASRQDPVGAFDEATGSLDRIPLETTIGCCDAYSIPGYERLPQNALSPHVAQDMRLARRKRQAIADAIHRSGAQACSRDNSVHGRLCREQVIALDPLICESGRRSAVRRE
jgi:hypothetical protein